MWVIFSNSRPWGVQCNWAFTLTTQTDKKLFFCLRLQNKITLNQSKFTPHVKNLFEMWVIFSNSRPWWEQCNWAFTLTTQTDKKLFFLDKTTKQNYSSQPIKIYTPRKKSIKPYRFQTKYLKAKKAVGKLEFNTRNHVAILRTKAYKLLLSQYQQKPKRTFLHCCTVDISATAPSVSIWVTLSTRSSNELYKLKGLGLIW